MHYAWVIVFSGFLTLFACLGLGRFALGMLLPSMGAGLGLDYAQMGLISMANFTGYLAMVVISGPAAGKWGQKRVILAGMGLIACSMAALSQSENMWVALSAYTLTGMGSAAANVPLMGLIGHWFGRSLRGRAAGYMVIGSGPAIMLSGWLIPLVNSGWGVQGWRVNWLVLAAVVAACAVWNMFFLHDRPARKGLVPAGGVEPEPSPAVPGRGGIPPHRMTAFLGVLYMLFGFSYVIYATFLVTSLVQERGFTEQTAGEFWTWVGAISLLSGPVFGGLSDRFGRRRAMMLVFGFQAAAYLLATLPLPGYAVFLSVGLWGVTAWSIPSIIAAAVGDYLGPARAALAFGTVTLYLGFGQVAGPFLAGLLAQQAGTLRAAFGVALCAACAALLLAGRLPDGKKDRRTS